jgi:phosphatidylserine/phosphatidylglycerophosphate/cardiolipin synthase-like enzyme
MLRKLAVTLALFLPIALGACSSESGPGGESSCSEGAGRAACHPSYPKGKADAPDPCAVNGWYDDADNFCDDPYGYCAMPDPDCGPEPDECGDTPESEGLLWKGDAHVGCQGPGAGKGEDVEMILTEPYCDVCSEQDKAVLKPRSPIVQKVVSIIDGATTSVDISQFTFSVSEIADAVERANDRGVKVRLAIDSAQNVPDSRAKQLEQKGVQVHYVSGKPAGDATGLLHAKFVIVDGNTLLTGSNNFSSTGTTINEENSVLLRNGADNPLLRGMACHFEAIWNSNYDAAGACSNAVVAFSPSSAPIKLIKNQLRAAKTSIDVIMHHFTFTDLLKELRNAAQRGVRVRVLLNLTTRSEHQGAVWNELVAAGGEIRYKQVNEAAYQLMHHKLAIIDGRVLLDGSGNWSGSAFFNNFENYALYDDPRVLGRSRELFHRLWGWSLTAESADLGRDAATQDTLVQKTYFGNLHAHFHAQAGGVALDDGHPEKKDDMGNPVPVEVPGDVRAAAEQAFGYGRDAGQLDFMALSPHCTDDGPGTDGANMSPEGFQAMSEAAAASTSPGFLALAGMEWSTNSLGNHVGVVGSTAVAKTERGRFDQFYGSYLPERERAGDRPLVMLNHPKTFRTDETSLEGNWDMLFGQSLLDIPKQSERANKFNDYGIDDFAPLKDVRDQWIAGTAMPDPTVVDKTLATVWSVASPYVRLMEVTLNRGTDIAGDTPTNPSIVESYVQPGTFERRTRMGDYEYFLTRGFAIAPAASHDNHYANWGTGHTSRTAIIAPRLDQLSLLDAIEQRQVYASEDQNLSVRFYAFGRVPMGQRTASPSSTIPVALWLSDPDYSGPYTVRVRHGMLGAEVETLKELTNLAPGKTESQVDLPATGEHFLFLEVWETGADRMAWSAPIWIERL